MLVALTLSMPNRGSWNGRWSGEDRLYCIIRTFKTQKEISKANELLSKGSFYYGWSDGWGASVSVNEVSRSEANKMQKKSSGFCGYDWMVDSILKYWKILATHEVEDFLKKQAEEKPAAVQIQNASGEF